MKLFDRLANLLGLPTENQQVDNTIQELLERARRFKYSQQYIQAMGEIEQAAILASKLAEYRISTMIDLQRADVLIQQNRAGEAEALLEELKRDAHMRDHQEYLAHILILQGKLMQRKNHWDAARTIYEQALKVSRDTRSKSAEGRAQGFLADTYLQEENASFAEYLLQEAVRKLSGSGDLELSSYFVGRLGEAKIQMGQVQEGQHILGRALRLAESLQYKQYELMWRQALAALAMSEGQYQEARRQYMLILAQSDTKMLSEDYIRTLCRMSKTSLRLNEIQAALDYAQQALELATKIEDASSVRLLAQAAIGVALRTAGGRTEDAVAYLQETVGNYEQVKTSDADYNYVEILRNLAAAHAEITNYETAIATYQEALTYAEAHDAVLEAAGTYRDLGILYTQQPDLPEAVKVWTTALEIYEANNQYARAARIYCDIANIRKRLGQPKRAMKDYEQALMLLSSIDDPETRGIVLSNAATAYVDYGDIETAEAFFVEAIKIALKLQDRQAEAVRRGNFGWFLLSTGRAERALVTLSYALQQSENLGLLLQSAVQTDNIGLAYVELGKYDKAVGYHSTALEKIQPLKSPQWEAVIRANLAHTLIALTKFEEAAEHLSAAFEVGTQLDNSEILVRVLTGQAKLALHENDNQQLDTLTQQAVEIAERVGSRRALANALILRSEFLYQIKKIEKAQELFNEADKLLRVLRVDPNLHLPTWLQPSIERST